MKKYGKMIISIFALIIIIGGSAIVYNKLSAEYRPNSLSQVGENDSGDQMGESKNTSEASDENQSQEPSGEDPEQVPAPDFTVENALGEEVMLSDFVGKPIVLNFWASWCGPCKNEMPDFQTVYETYGEDVVFLMVNLTDNSRETKETAMAYIEEEQYTFPVYFDVEQEAAYAYYVTSVPATYFIDTEGYVAAYGKGSLDQDTILEGLEMMGVTTK